MDTLYKQVEQTIRQHEDIFHVDKDVTESDVSHAIRWVMSIEPRADLPGDMKNYYHFGEI